MGAQIGLEPLLGEETNGGGNQEAQPIQPVYELAAYPVALLQLLALIFLSAGVGGTMYLRHVLDYDGWKMVIPIFLGVAATWVLFQVRMPDASEVPGEIKDFTTTFRFTRDLGIGEDYNAEIIRDHLSCIKMVPLLLLFSRIVLNTGALTMSLIKIWETAVTKKEGEDAWDWHYYQQIVTELNFGLLVEAFILINLVVNLFFKIMQPCCCGNFRWWSFTRNLHQLAGASMLSLIPMFSPGQVVKAYTTHMLSQSKSNCCKKVCHTIVVPFIWLFSGLICLIAFSVKLQLVKMTLTRLSLDDLAPNMYKDVLGGFQNLD